jgi:hypothetical protein
MRVSNHEGESMDLEQGSSPHARKQTGLTPSEKVASLFQPDTLLFTQFFDDRRNKTLRQPEKRLMLAILEDAIYCFQDNHSARHGKKKRLFNDVERWLFEANSGWLFAFENICSILEFNPEYVRKGLMRWREKELLKPHSVPLWKGPKKTPELEFSAPTIG